LPAALRFESAQARLGRGAALSAEAAERAFELGHSFPDAFEVLTGEREEPHRRARNHGGRPFSCQDQRNLAESITGTESVCPIAGLD
jgi:hypothetical protein